MSISIYKIEIFEHFTFVLLKFIFRAFFFFFKLGDFQPENQFSFIDPDLEIILRIFLNFTQKIVIFLSSLVVFNAFTDPFTRFLVVSVVAGQLTDRL
jgi:hypothetical protein